jgi:large subunit ribosomal protein LP1
MATNATTAPIGTASTTPIASTSPETAVSYAALLLIDAGLAITPEKLYSVLQAANISVEPIWTVIFAKALENKDVGQILTSISSSGPEVGRQQGVVENGDGNGENEDEGDIGGDKADGSDDECDLPLHGLFD